MAIRFGLVNINHKIPLTSVSGTVLVEYHHVTMILMLYTTVCGCAIIGRAKQAPHWGVQSRFHVIYIYIYMLSVCRISVVCQIN